MIILSSFGFRAEYLQDKFRETLTAPLGRLLIIPLASITCELTGEKEREAAVRLGFEEDKISVFSEKTPEEFLGQQFDYIYVPGGNTFKLLAGMKKYGLVELIRSNCGNGAVYIGASAGAHVACPDICGVELLDDNNHISDGDLTALGLIEKYVFCHYDSYGYLSCKRFRERIGMDKEVLTIDDDQVILLDR